MYVCIYIYIYICVVAYICDHIIYIHKDTTNRESKQRESIAEPTTGSTDRINRSGIVLKSGVLKSGDLP